MPLKIAEQIRTIALRCSQIAKTCTDKRSANELEGVSAELVQKAAALEELFNVIAEAS
jgi:hypothetical protein